MSSTKTVDKNGWKRDAPGAAKEDALHVLERKLRILLIYRKMIPSIRLCGHCQMEYLAGQGVVEYRALQEMKLKSSDLNWADIVLLGRLDSWYERRLVELLHESGRYLVYIIDDDLLNIPPEINSAAYYNKSYIQDNICAMIALSDAIISPSPKLLKKYASGKRAIQIEEPALNPVPYKPHDPNAPVKIGFAGSIDRTGDIEHILKAALIQIRQTYGDKVQFEFFGALPSFAKELKAKCIPYCDSYDEYRQTLNALEWDIGLAPMPDTSFHACKHYNKFVEYAAAGVVGVFSDVEPYKYVKELIGNPYMCKNTVEDWLWVLRRTIELSRSREEKRKSLLTIVCEKYSVERTAKSLQETICALDIRKQNKQIIQKRAVVLTGYKIIGVFLRGLWYIEKLMRKYWTFLNIKQISFC